MATATWGAVCSIQPPQRDKDGSPEYTVVQQPNQGPFAPSEALANPEFRREIDFSVFPFTIKGYVDTDRTEIGITVALVGIGIGTYYITFDQGLKLNVNLLLIDGFLRFFVEDSTLKLEADISITGDGQYNDTWNIVNW